MSALHVRYTVPLGLKTLSRLESRADSGDMSLVSLGSLGISLHVYALTRYNQPDKNAQTST